MIKITKDEAAKAYAILVAHAGAQDDPDKCEAFVHHVSSPDHPCEEYRFGGALGWGGKFRNNGNNKNIPYVDCYREHSNLMTKARIEVTNAALRELFTAPPTAVEVKSA